MIKDSFESNARSYVACNTVQKTVAKELVALINTPYQNILDIGCGAGEVIKNINWDYSSFFGIDSAATMLALHPKSENITLLHGDFEDKALYPNLGCDCIISASSLQWAKDLRGLLQQLKRCNAHYYLALFSANTFKELHGFCNTVSPLPEQEFILEQLQEVLGLECFIRNYTLEFQSSKELFEHLKKSGVNRESRLGFKEAKRLYREYEDRRLDFEVVFGYSNAL